MPDDIRQLDANFAATASADDGLTWCDIRDLGVDGRAFEDVESFYDRFPARARGVIPEPVWELSLRTAGMAVRFETDAAEIHVRWTLRFENLAMHHMPATGVSGLDLYGWTGDAWRFAGAAWPERFPHNTMMIGKQLDGRRRTYICYLPLYNGVEKVELAVPAGASIKPAAEPNDPHGRPILFYGTSIVNGGCASRPGMAYPAMIARQLNRRSYNFGFSGNARAEVEVARLLAELDPCAYVIDPLPNMNPQLVQQRIRPFVETLRQARPRTPIVLVEHITYQTSTFSQVRDIDCKNKNAALRAAYEAMTQAGVNDLHYLTTDTLLGSDF